MYKFHNLEYLHLDMLSDIKFYNRKSINNHFTMFVLNWLEQQPLMKRSVSYT